jgi:hypothetical protein
MTFDRTPWKASFTAGGRLPWTCPSCAGGRLSIADGTLHDGQTRQSRVDQQHLASDPEWIDGRFACLFKCPHCNADIAVAGTYRVRDDRYHDEVLGESGDYAPHYIPLFFSEAPHIISLPPAAPEEVKEELLKAFRLFWSDPESCANRIRSSLEKLLTAHRIQRTTGRTAKGRRQFLKLHERIERFRRKRPELANQMMAVKWLGNAGSHSSPISAEDVLDGFDLMEYVLDELYVRRAHRIGAITRAINRRKGPRSRRR